MALPGLSTLGVTLGYGAESTASTKPGSFTQLTRINSIGGISIDPDTIDASALEDSVEASVAGRGKTGGKFTVSVNFTPATQTEWETLISTYTSLTGGKQMWFEIIVPGFSDAFFVVAQPPLQLPMPEFNQANLLVMDIPLTIADYKGLDTKVSLS